MAQIERIGKYQITEVVGRGAMGVVYKAFDPNIRRTVAIKTIRVDGAEEGNAQALLARFRNEAQAAGRLTHPGIVGVHEYGEEDGLAYIAMEFIQGNSLREYFARGTRFGEADAVSTMTQLLEALSYAHEQGVWHRDIKPANLIVMYELLTGVKPFAGSVEAAAYKVCHEHPLPPSQVRNDPPSPVAYDAVVA